MTTIQDTHNRIIKQRVQIMRDERFIAMAGIMMIGTWRVDDKRKSVNGMPMTAYTNGRDVIYGKAFMDGLSDEEMRFVILHEYYHIMFMHMTMWKRLWDQNAMAANIAADIVINNMLDNAAGAKADNFIKITKGGALDHSFDGLDTGEVFRRLMQMAQQQGGGGKGQKGPGIRVPGVGGGDGEPLDEHDVSGDAEGDSGLSDEEVKELHQQIDTALRQGAQMAGKLGGKVDRSITDLLEPTVDWREQLQDFVKSYCAGVDLATWRKPARRWMARDGIYMPSRYSESTKRITIGVDTSGSIGPDQLRRALTEIKAACDTVNPEVVDIIYWDYDVAAHEIFEGADSQQIVTSTKPAGGGGTRVGCMLDYMRDKQIRPDCIIIFTDGYVESDWGGDGWPAPVLWAVSVKGNIAPIGKTLFVPAE